MGLVMNIGLSRFYRQGDENWLKALVSIVESGITDVICDAISDENWHTARIYEARRVGDGVEGRWLSDEEAAPIHQALAEVAERGTYASFAWDELDELGLEIQPLEILYARERDGGRASVLFPDGRDKLYMNDLRRTIRHWYGDEMQDLVMAMKSAAIEHGLIIHSA